MPLEEYISLDTYEGYIPIKYGYFERAEYGKPARGDRAAYGGGVLVVDLFACVPTVGTIGHMPAHI